jgi:hypothetical protein
MREINIIADNGGGLTLQLIDDDNNRYQHYYDSPGVISADIKEAQTNNNFAAWDGNEAEDEDGNDLWLYVGQEQIKNGGYRELTPDDLLKVKLDDCSWRNVRELAIAYRS